MAFTLSLSYGSESSPIGEPSEICHTLVSMSLRMQAPK